MATAAATEQSRALAEGTTAAARQIVSAVDTQRSETERVSTGVREIADVVTSAVAATTQTRATANGLREQAAQLERLIGRFEVEGRDEARPDPHLSPQ